MKFLVDAQLPRRLKKWLVDRGHDAIHTLDLPDKNRTSDDFISSLSMREKRVVISKDSDFFDRFFRKLEPHKLIYLTTGNITTDELIGIFERNFDRLLAEIEVGNVVEVSQTSIITID